MLDEIIITGCSFSHGCEMNDKILPNYNELFKNFSNANRKIKIYEWYVKNNKRKFSIKDIERLSFDKWNTLEKKKSWPNELAKRIECNVKNLSIVGASIGRNLIEFSNYLKNKDIKNKKIVAIHELPPVGRMYMKFLNFRINITPNNLGEIEKYYGKKINEKYKNLIEKDIQNNFFVNHYHRCLRRLMLISDRYNIESYFIFYQSKTIPVYFSKKNIILQDLECFIKKYNTGPGGHPIDYKFNEDLCNLILTKISH
jgi:hypothetical protein